MGDLKIKKIDPSQIRYTPEEYEVVQNPKGELLIWKDGQWNKVNMNNSGIDLSLYDMNKQIIAQLPDLEDFTEKTDTLNKFHLHHVNKFYMLYGKEISYFTLFKINRSVEFAATLFACLDNVGPIKAFDLTEAEDAIEIWVMSNGEPTCLYLFPYDMGLVEVGE